jgi:hypothetical protein
MCTLPVNPVLVLPTIRPVWVHHVHLFPFHCEQIRENSNARRLRGVSAPSVSILIIEALIVILPSAPNHAAHHATTVESSSETWRYRSRVQISAATALRMKNSPTRTRALAPANQRLQGSAVIEAQTSARVWIPQPPCSLDAAAKRRRLGACCAGPCQKAAIRTDVSKKSLTG